MQERLEAVFSRDGPLAAKISEYRVRSQQVEMAKRVAEAIRDNAALVCEAGTGTGKTFAYLVPALLSAGKVIISTGTKTLQDQLYHRDLPTVRDALKVPVTADLVVVNHHLFFADVVLKDEGMAELLPACNTVILDEAHQLPETASLFFGETLSTAQLLELSRDVRAETLAGAGDTPEAQQLAAALEKAARDLRLALPREGVRLAAASVVRETGFSEALSALDSALASLSGALEVLAQRSEGLARCSERTRLARAMLERWRDEDRADLVRWVEVLGHSLRL